MSLTIERQILKTWSLKKQLETLQKKFDAEKRKLQKCFDETTDKKVEANNIVAQKIERVFIEYDVEKLYKQMDRKIFGKITDKKYYITNIEGLIELLKEHKVKPKEFKKYINPEIKVNTKKLQQAYDMGEVYNKDIEGCYTAKITKYVELKEKVHNIEREGQKFNLKDRYKKEEGEND